MSLSESPVTADEDSDPSIDPHGSDADGSVSEDPEEEEYEEVEVEEEIEEEEVEEEEEEEEEEKEEEVEEEEEKEEEKEEEEEEEEEEENEEEEEEEKEEEKEEEEEEEEEEENEVEEEQEEEEEEVEEETDDKREVPEPPVVADKDPEDLSQHMEFEGQERNLRPVSSGPENPNMVSVEKNDSCTILTMKKEDFHLKHVTSSSPNSRDIVATAEDDKHQQLAVDNKINGSPLQSKAFVGCHEPSCDSKAYSFGVKDMDSGTGKSFSDTGKDVAINFQQKDCFLEDANVGTQNPMNQIKQLEIESGDAMKQMTSRFTSPEMRTRSLSPSANIEDGNQRPAIVCNFFAKGWCIRGSSCRFLHIKDHVNNTEQLAEGDLATTNWKREVQLEEGLNDNAEPSKMPDAPVSLAASLVSTYLHSSEVSLKETIRDEQEASPIRYSSQDKQKFPLVPKEDLSSKNQALPIGRDSSKLRDSLFPENSSLFASSNYFCMNLSSYPPRTEGLTTIQSQHMCNKYTSPVMNHSLNSSLVTQLPTMSKSLSHQISASSGYSLSFNSSIGANTLDAQKLLNSGKEYRAPRSTFFGSEQEEAPLVSSSGVPPHASRYKTKISSYDWEPSVPFRPSFFITATSVSSPGDLYDPFNPSVEIPNIGDGSLKASFFIHGPPIQSSSQVRTYGEYAVAGDKVVDLNDDKSSVSSHNRFYESEPNKSYVPCEKDRLAPEKETLVRTYLNSQNGKIDIGENTLGVGNITKTEKERTEHGARHQGEGSGRKRKRVDKAKKINEMNVDSQMDGNVQTDLKALKIFRAALVELVKELLKPSWQEGRLSRDAHNTIVKKSVDKVISTLQPHQIPTTMDSVNHYVSSSRLKIVKLVDGYVNKYGKS